MVAQPSFSLVRTVLVSLLAGAVLFSSCSSQPAKYRHSNDCKCPKWNYLPQPPRDSERADRCAAPAPYYCDPGSES